MTATNVPAPAFGPNGVTVPAESAILAGVLADLNAAFGGNMNTALTTSQGQFASALAAVIGDGNASFLAVVNAVDPAYSFGRFQDAIGRVVPGNGFARTAAVPTVTSVACSGAPGVAVPLGALVLALDGNCYASTQAGTIPVSGSVQLSFACLAAGPVACPAQVFTIYRTVPGWDSAASAAAGVPGSLVETAADYEARRTASVAANALGTLGAIRGAVLQVAGVLDCYVTDNPAGTAVTAGGISLPARSLYVCAFGGAAADIARAIWTKKAPGCGYAGNTAVTVCDTSYANPPAYAVTFEVPALVQVAVNVVIIKSASVPAGAQALVAAAVLAAFAGTDGGPRATIGATLLASRYYCAVTALGAWARVIDIQVASFSAASFTGTVTATSLAVSGVTGALAIGQVVTGCTVPTTIVAGSGANWTVADTQISPAGPMTAAAPANTLGLTIAQMPVLQAQNVVLTQQ